MSSNLNVVGALTVVESSSFRDTLRIENTLYTNHCNAEHMDCYTDDGDEVTVEVQNTNTTSTSAYCSLKATQYPSNKWTCLSQYTPQHTGTLCGFPLKNAGVLNCYGENNLIINTSNEDSKIIFGIGSSNMGYINKIGVRFNSYIGWLPWTGPNYSGPDMDLDDIFYLNSATGYLMYDWIVPDGYQVLIKGCIISCDDQSTGETFRVGVSIDGTSANTKNTEIKDIANWGTYELKLSAANYVSADARDHLTYYCKADTDNTLEVWMQPYGSIRNKY